MDKLTDFLSQNIYAAGENCELPVRYPAIVIIARYIAHKMKHI